MKIVAYILIAIALLGFFLFFTGCASSASHATPFGAVTPAVVTNWTAQATPSNGASYRLYWRDPSGTHHVDNPTPLWKLPSNYLTCWAVGLDAQGNESKVTSNVVTNT